ncbi:hypothetical protein [Sinorhizobium sp. BG8]|uniref:hypothetical protein n=1 Tax=Sinorhizobium sp. BG8 TaxID=2613773 RepID=UPI001FEEBCC5|nr:hypothetical protein [Sinorhizobium sp. BG8]
MAAALLGLVVPAVAQEPAPAKAALEVELNTLAPSQKGCLFTFVAGNHLERAISRVSFEFVIFNEKGTVERMVVLDFRDLPLGKTKVRQFDLPGTKCEAVKRLLINDAPVCEGEGLAKDACATGLVTRSNTTATFEG